MRGEQALEDELVRRAAAQADVGVLVADDLVRRSGRTPRKAACRRTWSANRRRWRSHRSCGRRRAWSSGRSGGGGGGEAADVPREGGAAIIPAARPRPRTEGAEQRPPSAADARRPTRRSPPRQNSAGRTRLRRGPAGPAVPGSATRRRARAAGLPAAPRRASAWTASSRRRRSRSARAGRTASDSRGGAARWICLGVDASEVGAAHDVGDPWRGVVDDDRELVGEQTVRAHHDEIADIAREVLPCGPCSRSPNETMRAIRRRARAMRAASRRGDPPERRRGRCPDRRARRRRPCGADSSSRRVHAHS